MDKKQNLIIFLLFLFVCLWPFSVDADHQSNIRKKFSQIRAKTIWPVVGTNFDNIISPFGPRWLGRYDWHYGLDIEADKGTKVRAVTKGVVYKIIQDEDDGNLLILKHKFPRNTKFKGRKIKYYYTWYLHLDRFKKGLRVGQRVKKGQVIAYVGQTGNATSPHLHLELRVGEVWSQAYNHAGYDPAVNPMFLFRPTQSNISLLLLQKPTKRKDARIRFISSDEQPLLNKVKLQIKNFTRTQDKKKIVKQYILDLNHRTGFDATSIEKLDQPDRTKPYLDPLANCFSLDNYYIDIIIPHKYIQKYLNSKYRIVLKVYDIWGRSQKIIL